MHEQGHTTQLATFLPDCKYLLSSHSFPNFTCTFQSVDCIFHL